MVTLSHYVDLIFIFLNADGFDSAVILPRDGFVPRSPEKGPNGDRCCHRQQPPPLLQRYERPALHERYCERSHAVAAGEPFRWVNQDSLSNLQLLIVLTVVHMCTADDEYDGYCIPKGTIVMGNTWSVSL